jgi:hypothetical protein
LYTNGSHPEKFAKFAFAAFDDDHTGRISFQVENFHFAILNMFSDKDSDFNEYLCEHRSLFWPLRSQ